MKLSADREEEARLWAATEDARKTKIFDLDSTAPKETYQLLTSAIIPRPIAFVSSLSSDGVPNLAPFSYFSMISHNPPMLSVSFALSARRPKDTRENILQTKEFTVNIISEPFIEAANSTSVLVKPPIVEESAVSMECELYSHQDISSSSSVLPTATLVLGLIKRVHVRESFLSEDGSTLDPTKLRPVARLGGVTYARVVEGFDLPRVSWKATKGVYEEIDSTQKP
ncbi:hypothetical protein P691DRAFT_806024 [Macrolepiota fuliginosa MF-IS2]|uniref:Flavin reductase like domain-containing protein n=1 Tax=Macrolepiota fuliginosa MF-IS2 TaxID=1400762 RepID=A0A9P5XK82_9AGAR|nr:hypothetical protein P691DRAFT_806024 [Macrolepiota fuliginosa MF-IS2]